ncbi:hypothetical protein EJ05DRAFT_476392 [Pseudovirgaria hyperparasitica]|uniref:ARID domain-containing protein n=1 Tax=Pseudovirgaria hyperparasitica TaxID=470096 RepID=A0A6A6W5H8_9PEZI|nr:uncharacterized protein EJ05DRAFT_476392 [Pseudovirgaria hyperparasitica]KAF2758132.1 hypothetical protein EJ05DRAFT_476392 [Pseudovirgaria hyperparasitica]
MNSFAPDFSNNNGMYNQNGGMPNANQAMFDPSMFGQGMQNNQMQNGGTMSPGFPNQPSYQVNQVIPSKRPRPNEENPGASPRPGSRSQTPQMPFPGYQGNQLQAPTPFQHLQQGGSQNATPSPTMQNQQFRPPGAPPQRVNTVSPNPNPYPQHGMGMSPPNGPNSRVGTPQNHNMGQMGGMNFVPGMQGGANPQAFNQNFGAGRGMPQGMGNMPQLPPHLNQKSMDVQKQYQMQMQHQQQQLAAGMGMQQRHPGMNPMFNAQGPGPGPGQGQGQPQGMPPGAMRPGPPNPGGGAGQPQQFLAQVAAFMQRNGRPFNHSPVVCGQPVNLAKLFQPVIRQGGSAVVTQHNAWPQIAQMMGYPPQNFPSAPAELKFVYEQNLGPYESVHLQKVQQNRAQAAQQGQMPGGSQPQMSPTRQMPGTPQNLQAAQQHAQQQAYMQQLQRAQQPQLEHSTPGRNVSGSSANGWSPQADQTPSRTPNAMNQAQRKSMERPLQSTPPHGQHAGFPTPSPGPEQKFERAPTSEPVGPVQPNGVQHELSIKVNHGTEYHPKTRYLVDTHGGIPVEEAAKMGEDIARAKPTAPMVEEMGVIDIRALSLSIQSGIHAEVRHGLDDLARITCDQRCQLELERSEDLLDILIDCAEEQVELLADGAPEVSDIIDLNSYEDVLRNCKQEVESLQDIPEFGSPEYELNSAANKLLAITVILRNLSFFEFNHHLLAGPTVYKFLSNTIRLMGTRILLLRTHVNTFDFMKDIVTFFSNTTHVMGLPSREDAFNILHFLLAFAPTPAPSTPVRFTPYDPSIHKYLPAAVDCLAKLLARDDPNRAYYKNIFALDAASSPPYDLLTRSFALAISVAPTRNARSLRPIDLKISEARKPYFTQGMLAADILSSLAPGPESGLARSWLDAEDGWAASLVHFALDLLHDHAAPPPGHRGQRPPEMQDQGFKQITHRALTMLKRLAEKSSVDDSSVHLSHENGHDESDEVNGENSDTHQEQRTSSKGGLRFAASLVPKVETLLGAHLIQSVDGAGLSKLVRLGDSIR